MKINMSIAAGLLAVSILFPGCSSQPVLLEPGTWQSSSDVVIEELTKGFQSVPDANTILDVVLTDWLTSPERREWAMGYVSYHDETNKVGILKAVRFDKRFFPKGYAPRVPGVAVKPLGSVDEGWEGLDEGEIGIRLDKFQVQEDTSVSVTFVNSGFCIIGGAFVDYVARKVGDKWVVTFAGLNDP